ncbi:MAG: DUF177 domain-containing protein [bacterium]|nr:DUF177 domain-containing protein [bacterium]
MKIDLAALENDPAEFQEMLELSAERLDADLVRGAVATVITGQVRRLEDAFAIEGSLAAEGDVTCGRCLEPLPWSANEKFSVELRPAANAPSAEEVDLGGEDLEVAFIEDSVLDLEEFAAEQVVLALPMRALCDEKCAGLCLKCGENLNTEGKCQCEPDIDPRWEALRGLGGQPS